MKFILLIALFLTFNFSGFTQVRYSGRKHTTSHGGNYKGGRGSSHRGGTYKNVKTSNRYGRHKK